MKLLTDTGHDLTINDYNHKETHSNGGQGAYSSSKKLGKIKNSSQDLTKKCLMTETYHHKRRFYHILVYCVHRNNWWLNLYQECQCLDQHP